MKVSIETIYQGGYIKTTLLDAAFIQSAIINASYIQALTINFTQGSIGTWVINSDGLSDTTGSAYILSRKTHSAGGVSEVKIGPPVTSPDLDTEIGSHAIAAQFTVSRGYVNGFNTAIVAIAENGLSPVALDITGQIVCRDIKTVASGTPNFGTVQILESGGVKYLVLT